jgi:peptidoglycan biosynthesis protein MviN/MurJ (putative lipid II flippase)
MLGGQALMSVTGITDQFFAAHLSTGAIATLSYANRILALILGMGAMAVSRATLPVFSRALAQGGEQVHRVAIHWVRLMFALGVVTMLVSWFFAPWGVKLLFERGAFTAQDTAIVTEVLRYGLTQLPFYFAGIVLVSLLSSQGRYRAIAVIASVNLFAKLAAMVILTPVLDINGIALSTTIMYAVSMLLLNVSVNKARR